MKIGILSMQRIINYGSFMQAYGLKCILEEMGHQCEFIDILPGENISGIPYHPKSPIQKIIDKLLSKKAIENARKGRFWINLRAKFIPQLNSTLGLSEQYQFDKHYDAVVIGSDEVFNCFQSSSWGFTPQLFGELTNADLVISYAASFGYTTMEMIQKEHIEDRLKRALSQLKAISVRDQNSAHIIEQLTEKTPSMNFDPALLYLKTDVPDVELKDYIILYAYQDRIKDPKEIDAIIKFARKENKKLISIGSYTPWCDKSLALTPFEMLSYFKCADYVITDTFHGTIFAVKFHRQFSTFIRPSNKSKLEYLLRSLSLQERACSDLHRLNEILLSPCEFDRCDAIIAQGLSKTKEYFQTNL